MFGMPTLIEVNTLEDNMKLCKSLGLDFVEINMNLPQYQNLNIEETRTFIEKYKVQVSFHANECIDPFNLDDQIRSGYLSALEKTFCMAEQLEVKKVTIHLSKGVYFTMPNRKIYLYEKFEDQLKVFTNDLIALLEEYDVNLLLENTGILGHGFVKRICEQLIEHPKIFLTYDIGHDYSSGYKDQAFYEKHKKQIRHYHIHDAIGEKNHLALFTGEIDLDPYLSQASVIEVKTIEALTTSVNTLKERGYL